MGLSIIILNHNEKQSVLECLESLAPYLRRPECECMVADNASTDGSVEELHSRFPYVKVMANCANIGISRARNAAFRETAYPYVLSLDSDVKFISGDLFAGTAFLDSRPGTAMLGPRLLEADGAVQYSCRRFLTAPVPVVSRLPFLKILPGVGRLEDRHLMKEFDHAAGCAVDYVLGACQLWKKSDFFAAGGYDEKIFFGPEDADIGLRLKLAGKSVFYKPDIVFSHVHRRRTRNYLSPAAWHHMTGLVHYFRKHRYLFTPPTP
jgi:N-acetylglucosaminyl-diphospho-decaprenol L-rhamnosyltransferase